MLFVYVVSVVYTPSRRLRDHAFHVAGADGIDEIHAALPHMRHVQDRRRLHRDDTAQEPLAVDEGFSAKAPAVEPQEVEGVESCGVRRRIRS
jgi:hypothetical protein